jgi:hypothetical protein
MESHLLRDPWALSLLVLMAACWFSGLVSGYVWGWRFGDPFAVAWRWVRRKAKR